MKFLLGLILLVVLGSVMPGIWHGLGTMEKVWAIIILVGLASLFIPGLRPLAVKMLLLVLLIIFLVGMYGKARQAYHATMGNLKATAGYMAMDLWQTGKDWLGSLVPSLTGSDDLLDMAAGARTADEAYGRCLVDAATSLGKQGRIPAGSLGTVNTCAPRMAQDASCMNRLEQIVTEADPSEAQRCVRNNVVGRGQAGIKPLADKLCFNWLPEFIQDKVCVDKWSTPAGSAEPGTPASTTDINQVNSCLYTILLDNKVEASACDQYAQGKDPQRWQQCAAQRTRQTFGTRADAQLRQCGVN
ncbi:MAG: hypothetical protein DYH20_02340 [Gammaproteobacteria bacterium PRO9]|nr:hypothetical protein [Gammaproteobacteria bacterium PRO9]